MANDTLEAFLQPKTEATAAWLSILFVGLGNVYAGELIAEVQVRGTHESAEDFLTMLIPLPHQGVLSQVELGKPKQTAM